MKFHYLMFVLLVGTSGCSPNRAAQTSSARAAYSAPAPFKAHIKKNKKVKKKATKKNRKSDTGRPYRTLPM